MALSGSNKYENAQTQNKTSRQLNVRRRISLRSKKSF